MTESQHEIKNQPRAVANSSDQGSNNAQVSLTPPAIQRQCVDCDDEGSTQMKFSDANQAMPMETIQRAENNTGMPDEVKGKMESAIGADFSDVRMHTDSSSATNVGALAYTQGSDVHFAPGQFKPDTTSGQELIGHELTHVVQQREGRVQANTSVGGMPVNDSPKLEGEADALGKKAAQMKVVQRAEDDEELE